MGLKIDRAQLEIVIMQDSARKQLADLEKDMDQVRRQMNQIPKSARKGNVEYEKLQQRLKSLKSQYDEVFSTIDVGNLTLKELTTRQRDLNAILRNLDPSLPLWKEYNDQLKKVNARIGELRGRARDTGMSLSKVADGLNRYATMAATAMASITGITLTAKQCVDEFAQMAEAEAQVAKYTGLTAEEIQELQEEFKKMDTRTPREKLNALAGDAGRLGITAKKDILEFVDAANQINVALGEDLGEDAVANIGKLAQMFGEDKDLGLRGAMLATGSAINEVAQKSAAAEKYLVEFTARVAGVAHQAGISQADILGFAAAMDENMLRNETSATAYQNILMKLFTDTEKFAQVAGLNLQEFAKLVRTDANEALLTFAKAMSKKGGMADLAPIFGDLKTEGAGVVSVLAVLAGKADDVRVRQEIANKAYREGTSATKEYGIQNTTVLAQLEKAKKDFQDIRIELGGQLLPVMKYMISTGKITIKGLQIITSLLIEYKSEIITAGLAVAAYTLYVKKADIATKAYTLATKTATLATNLFSKATKLSPWGLVIAGVTAAISYFALFKKRTDEATDAQKDLNTALDNLKGTLDRIAGIDSKLANLQFLNKDQKLRLRDDIQGAITDLDNLVTESMIANKTWYEDEKKRLMQLAGDNQILQKNYLKNLDDDLHVRMEKVAGYLEKKKSLEAALAGLPLNELGGDGSSTTPTDADAALKEAENKLKLQHQDKLNTLKMALIAEKTTQEQYRDEVYKAEMVWLLSRKALLEKYGKDTTELQGTIYDKMIAEANRITQDKQRKAAQEQADDAESLNKQYQKEQTIVKQKYIDGQYATEAAYKEALLQLERNFLERRRALLVQYGGDTTDIDAQLADMGVAGKKAGTDKKRSDGLKAIDEESNFAKKNEMLEAMYNADLLTYEQYQQQKDRIAEEHEQVRNAQINATLDTLAQAAGAANQVFQAMQDAEILKTTQKYDKQIKAAKKAGKDTAKLEEEKEAAINAIKKKYADKQFAAAVLQVTATTAVTAMEAYKAMAGIPVVGPALGAVAAAAAVAAGAAQIAVAKTQRDEAKGLKSGGYSDDYVEGYTRTGNPDDVAGVIPVHKNEFVANHHAVANPSVRQFLDVFDVAQRDGSIRMINTTQILERVRTRSGRYEGGYVSTSSPMADELPMPAGATPAQRLQVVELLQECNRLLRIISEKEVVVDPRKMRDSIKRVEQLERNVSR